MKEQLSKIRAEALSAMENAQSAAELDGLRVQYLGKKGELTAVLKMMGKLSPEERPAMGQLANEVRAALESAIEEQGKRLEAKALEARLEAEAVDAAGNRSRAAAAFVIDHTPPEILFEGVENGVAYEERRTCTVRLGNSSDRIKEIRINGERQALETDTDEYSCTFEEHQVYSIRVTAVDRAGNEKEEAVMFQVVPKQTLVDRLLSPARQSLGLEEIGRAHV